MFLSGFFFLFCNLFLKLLLLQFAFLYVEIEVFVQ